MAYSVDVLRLLFEHNSHILYVGFRFDVIRLSPPWSAFLERPVHYLSTKHTHVFEWFHWLNVVYKYLMAF